MATRETEAGGLTAMPDGARLWVFAAPRALTREEAAPLLQQVDAFVSRWKAHGHPVVGAWEWRHDRFLLVAADEEATGVSGCSIDSLFRTLQDAERTLGVPLVDASPVWYRDRRGEIRAEARPEFRARVRAGEVGPDTPVFDNTVSTVGALRSGGWERPMRDSWHARAFG